MKNIPLFCLFIFGSVSMPAFAQTPPSNRISDIRPIRIPQQEGPYTHQIESASSPDGLNWAWDHLVIAQHAQTREIVLKNYFDYT